MFNIIWYLSVQLRRFSEFRNDIYGILLKVLIDRLKKFEFDGVVYREVMFIFFLFVEYLLIEFGKELKFVIDVIVDVGKRLKDIKEQCLLCFFY